MGESRVERRERERREEAARRRAREAYPEETRGRRTREAYPAEERRRPEREKNPGRGSKSVRKRDLERKKRNRKVAGIIILIIILLAAFTGLRVYLEARPGAAKPIVKPGSDEFAGIDRVNLLFLGTNQGLSDTFMVFSVQFNNKRVDQVSVPRDTYYYRPDYPGAAYQKINSVYSSAGPEAACIAASDVLGGIPIHYYMVLEPEGIKKIVDAMGGVVIDVPMDMQYVDADQDLYIDLRAGTQKLNGDQAMQYLRFRSGYANADLGRVSAQQEFLKAIISQSEGFDYPKIALAARSEIKTNMSSTAQAGFLARMGGLKGVSFNTQTIPGTTGMQDGLSYFFHDEAGTKELMSQIYAGESPAEE